MKFVEAIQQVYGPYNPVQAQLVGAWASGKSQELLNLVFSEITRTFSLQFKAMPFIPEFEEAEHVAIEIISNNRARLENDSRKLLASDKPNKEVPFEELKAAIAQGPEAVKAFKAKYFGEAV